MTAVIRLTTNAEPVIVRREHYPRESTQGVDVAANTVAAACGSCGMKRSLLPVIYPTVLAGARSTGRTEALDGYRWIIWRNGGCDSWNIIFRSPAPEARTVLRAQAAFRGRTQARSVRLARQAQAAAPRGTLPNAGSYKASSVNPRGEPWFMSLTHRRRLFVLEQGPVLTPATTDPTKRET